METMSGSGCDDILGKGQFFDSEEGDKAIKIQEFMRIMKQIGKIDSAYETHVTSLEVELEHNKIKEEERRQVLVPEANLGPKCNTGPQLTIDVGTEKLVPGVRKDAEGKTVRDLNEMSYRAAHQSSMQNQAIHSDLSSIPSNLNMIIGMTQAARDEQKVEDGDFAELRY